MRIAVTGGSGFIGRRLVAHLLERGDEVLVLSRRPEQARRVLGASPNLKLLGYDPYQPQSWASALEGYEAVVNLAGEPLASSAGRKLRKERSAAAAWRPPRPLSKPSPPLARSPR
jgi:uncharacterized protein